ncbi:mismatch repair endonuclease PMS2-like [Babylonia areolata]|uniref:mismatch repair endonuclease PMS2-like n=1 Tax=Babylonia areolata TaxID=304850 RepID=UPI003FD05EDB
MAASEEKRQPTDDNILLSESLGENESVSVGMDAGSIQAIDKQSVHRICSGQVVLTLATAVKELVENSIDAGATTVDIKLKEYGSENIEVTDNGSGVEEKNFVGLTQKHHTSKLSDFNDLINVETFGFRGEALSSLCALSHMTVTTRHKSVAVGTKLEYDANGQIVSKTPVPRQQGTTVCLQSLFHTLPVRHKEFQRNVKKEFTKMVQVLNAYCLINTGIRITCSNQTSKGSRSTVVTTNGNSAVKDNISNIFGPKQLQSLLPFEQHSPTEDVCTDYGIQSNASQSDLFSIEGFVSKCEHGQGRGSTDRQFVFINRRPCDSTKILKVINEVYHTYNRHQYPFVVLLISMAKESVDVNVTPDKRQIFMEGEKILLATIKTSLIKMFEPTTSVLRVNMVPHQSGSSGSVSESHILVDDSSVSGSPSQSSPNKYSNSSLNGVKDGALSSLARLKRSFSSAFDRTDHSALSPHTTPSQPDKQRKLETFLTKRHSTPASFSPHKGAITSFFTTTSTPPSQKTQTPEATSPSKSVLDDDDVIVNDNPSDDRVPASVDETSSASCRAKDSARLQNGSHPTTQNGDEVRIKPELKLIFHELGTAAEDNASSEQTNASCAQTNASSVQTNVAQGDVPENDNAEHDASEGSLRSGSSLLSASGKSDKQAAVTDDLDESETVPSICAESGEDTQVVMHSGGESGASVHGISVVRRHDDSTEEQAEKGAPVSLTLTQFDHQESHPCSRPETELRFDFQQLRKCLMSPEMSAEGGQKGDFSRSFRAKISPTDNQSAEEELRREISKDMFSKMDVLGQFNLGFIIAKHREDLFIVDQHATDEKYNFEMLQRHTVLQSQQLIHPQNLELTASNEVILMDNLDIFRKNGFDFIVDETAPPTQRVKLKSTPVSKNWSFGKDDIEELIFMLTDSPGVMCRPSRVRMMFASRACRKSIMIGTHLNKPEMKKLLCHMGEIEQPWNCPHGRPTMRHLINLNMLPR